MKQIPKLTCLLIATVMCLVSVAQTGSPILENIGGNYYLQNLQNEDSSLQLNLSERSLGTNWISNASGYGGAVPKDIFYLDVQNGNDKIYVYGKRNIIILDAVTHEIIGTVNNGGTNISNTSQYYPPVERTEFLNYNHFAYNPNNQLLYCALENSNVIAINTADDSFTTIISPWELCLYLTGLNCFIKYDSRLDRIYYAISTTTLNELRVFDAYDNSPLGMIGYDSLIRGLEINNSEDELYISLGDHFKRLTFDPELVFNTTNVDEYLIGPPLVGSLAGNLLMVEEEVKLFCFPSTGSMPDQNYYILNTLTKSVTTKQCPSNVSAACFDGDDKVYIAYQADNAYPDLRIIDVYDYNYGDDIDTHGSNTSDFNITMDLDFLGGKLIISKASEVTTYDPLTGNVQQFKKDNNFYFSRICIPPSGSNNDSAYVINTWGTGVDVFDANGQVGNPIDLGGIAFYACHSDYYDKIYFYNKHIQDHGKVYVFNMQTNETKIITIPGSISGIVIDPVTNNALVSTFNNSYQLKVIEDDQLLDATDWLTTGHKYISDMYMSPANKLYFVSGSNDDNNQTGIEIGELGASGYTYKNFKAYSTIHRLKGCFTIDREDEVRSDPVYVYVAITDDGSQGINKLIKIDDGDAAATVTDLVDITESPQDIVYENAYNYIYISHADANHTLTVIECRTGTVYTTLTFPHEILDIKPNGLRNFIYVLHAANTNPVTTEISKVTGANIDNERVTGLSVNSSSMKFNIDNSMLYVHVPFIDKGCDDGYGGIYEIFDNNDGNWTSQFFGDNNVQRRLYLGNPLMPLNHDIVFDNEEHMLYYGGGGHSCVNSLELTSTYKLPIRTDTPVTWLSIPRHIRNSSPDLTSTNIVFAQENISSGYSYLNLQYNDPIPGSPYTPNIVTAEWGASYPPDWDYDDDIMKNIHSARGYKLGIELQNPLMAPYIELEGTVQDPYTTMDLLCHEENWIGYFLYEEQFVLDAIAPIKPDVYHIMHQDFVCYRYNFITTDCHTKSTNGPTPGTWICGAGADLKYGDMVIVKAGTDISGFQWQSSGNPPDQSTRSPAEYFGYEEEISYTTILIELDTTAENPQEIGAFVNDTCVGACSVIETDSVVIMRAYLGDQPGDSVVFEEYSSAKSTTNNRIDDYFVLNPENRIKERRAIKTGENSDVFTVSFRKEVENKITVTKGIELNIFPNPARNRVNIGYTLESDGTALIEIFDNMGRKLRSVSTADQASGSYSLQYELRDGRGVKLESGIYLFRLTACGQTISKKLLVK